MKETRESSIFGIGYFGGNLSNAKNLELGFVLMTGQSKIVPPSYTQN